MSTVAEDVARIAAVLADANAALRENRPIDLQELNGMVEQLCDRVRADPEKATPETVATLGRLIEDLDALATAITKRRDDLAARLEENGE